MTGQYVERIIFLFSLVAILMEHPSKPTTHHVTLKNRQEVTKGTMALYFDRPTTFTFKAGQFIDLSLPQLSTSDPQGYSRAFTLASAPSEQQLMVATRFRDTAFKRMLRDMPLGMTVDMEGPFGQFTMQNNDSRSVFLAGGIGITPFRSMLVEAARHKFPQPLILLYSNRRPEEAAFLQELQSLEQDNHSFKCIGTITNPNMDGENWKGETGRMDQVMLKKYVKDMETAFYYVVGPPAMVKGLCKMLETAGIQKTNIRSEEFLGY
jgi:ferredoxin-NADP reductase